MNALAEEREDVTSSCAYCIVGLSERRWVELRQVRLCNNSQVKLSTLWQRFEKGDALQGLKSISLNT